MVEVISGLVPIVLFLAGLRLSAFFSGSETGFYRLSVPRLTIDSRAGDVAASRLLWFAQRPAYFVATCLIGNNLANYLTTAAISLGVLYFVGQSTEAGEIASTLLLAPVVFLFGELLPKNVYYQAPLTHLTREIRWFRLCFYAFFPVSVLLVMLTRVLERLTGENSQTTELMLGRNRLVQIVQHGHQEGVLTEIQSQLANGLLQMAPEPITSSMIPLARVIGLADDATCDEAITFAKNFGLPAIPVRRKQPEDSWYAYVHVTDLVAGKGAVRLHASTMPHVDYRANKLEVLHILQTANSSYAVVERDGAVLGLITRNGLVSRLFRRAPATHPL